MTDSSNPRVRSSGSSRVTMPNIATFDGAPPATILDWLRERFPRVPTGVWASRVERGDVTLDAQGASPAEVVTADRAYAPGRRVRYFREVEAGAEPKIPFRERIIHEDERLVVVDKPPFLPVIPSGPFVQECLLERLRKRPGCEEAVPLHRLDRLTSGLVLFARRPEDRGVYGELFAERRVEKRYHALARVEELSDAELWRVRTRIRKGTPFFRMRQDLDGEPNSETEVRWVGPVEGPSLEAGHALFDLRPITGKTHQLRLHMTQLGWPIAGDPLYPELREKVPDRWQEPLRLVAKELRFQDPRSGAARHFLSGYRVERLPERADDL